MNPLRDSLAAALSERLGVRYGTVTDWGAHLSDAILSDEAFRTALGASLAEAQVARLNEDPDALGKYIPEDLALWAAGVVERMLA